MKIISKIRHLIILCPMIAGMSFVQGCSEAIEEMPSEVPVENTIITYLQKHSDVYSEYLLMLDSVSAGETSSSSVSQLLDTHANYTCFAPTNEAIHKYLIELEEKGVISNSSWEAPEFQVVDPETNQRELLQRVRQTIVYNSLIGAGVSSEAYQTSDFCDEVLVNEMLPRANMNMRKLRITEGNGTKFAVAGSNIDDDNCNIYTVSGYIHQVHKVIEPDVQTVSQLFEKILMDKEYGFYTYAALFDACGLNNELNKLEDETYYQMRMNGNLNDLPQHPTFAASGDPGRSPGRLPEHRYYGYTLFLEPDAWWESALMLPDNTIHTLTPKEVVEKIAEYVVINNLYLSGATTDNNYSDENNALNQFVTYHLLPAKIEPNKLVIHFNELWYNLTTMQKTASVYDFHTTMGKRRLLKTYEANKTFEGKRNVIYLNRFPILKNGTSEHDNYTEKGCEEDKKGVEILVDRMLKSNNANIYPISDCLFYNDAVAETFGNERIRMDATTLFPELISNDIRCNEKFEAKHQCVGLPSDGYYKYIDNMEINEDTYVYYLSGRISENTSWINYQGDELSIVGNYDFTIKLPPVPKDGEYEIRMGVSANDRRGLCQVYWGTNKNALTPVGMPVDMRMGGQNWYVKGGMPMPSIVGWEADEDDIESNAAVDKNMRNNWYMKAPNYFYWYGQSTSARHRESHLRRILVREQMKADETYYINFRSLLDDNYTEFFLDYIEYCPKKVYFNPDAPEDIW